MVTKTDINNNLPDDNRLNNQSVYKVNNYTDIKDIQDFVSSVYPNPVTNNLIITTTESIGQTKVSIYSMTGKLIYTTEVDKNQTKIDMSKFDKGCYILNISAPKGIKTYKIIKE